MNFSNQRASIALLMAVLLLNACGGGGGGNGPGPTDPGGASIGSCTNEPPNISSCTDFTGSIWTSAIVEQQCLDAGGSIYSSSSCAEANSALTIIGSCASNQGPGTEIVVSFYAPFNPVTAENGCTAGGGVWSGP